MEETASTECLRNLAPHWNLDGDKKLLSLLQDMHQKIMTRCEETSTKLEEMAITLDGANIDLQNVNNKFMALSNSQFIESRVYDDDLDVSVEEKATKTENAAASNQDIESDLAKLKKSLTVLESMHESVRILNSDSDSDSDEGDGRMVFRPKDLYAERPLPYIIGSQAWKSKWHAGIIAEESDSDSTTSKPENEEPEQYSESDSELTDTRTDRLNPPQRTISSTSSTVESEPSVPPPLSQATVAAELARKLAGNLPQIPVETSNLEAEYTKPRATTSQVYRPQNPQTSNIFFDEPPPIDQSYQSDNDYNDEEDDDIFAELHKTKPSFPNNKDQSRVNQDLFGDFDNTPDGADLFGAEKKESTVQRNNEEHLKESDKKPVGGISVFGSSKGTESIGAAILKRNQRKTYSSDEEDENRTVISEEQNPKGKTNKEQVDRNIPVSKDIPKGIKDTLGNTTVNKNESISKKKTEIKKEKDILQDLFDKNKPNKTKNDQQMPTKEKTDLFSDDLFDDIDDIFTDTIVKVPIKEASKNVKSIFDDDDDDLFADLAVTSQKETTSKCIIDNKAGGLFDSDDKDDDLFSEDPKKSEIIQIPENNVTNDDGLFSDIEVTSQKETTSKNIVDNKEGGLFGSDDKDDDLFSGDSKKSEIIQKPENNVSNDDGIFADIAVTSQKDTASKSIIDNKEGRLFESDDKDDDLFSGDPKKSEIIQKPENNVTNDDGLFFDIEVTSLKETTGKRNVDNKAGGLFDSDYKDDDLFSKERKKSENHINKANNVTVVKNKETKIIFDDDSDEDLFSDINIKKSPDEDIKKNTSLEGVFKKQSDPIKPIENKEEGKDDDNNNLFSGDNIGINSAMPQYSTSKGEVIVNKETEQIHNVGNKDKLNDTSQNSRDVTFILQAETPTDKTKISSGIEKIVTVHETLNHREGTIKDDWKDSYNDSKYRSIPKSSEDAKNEDNHTIATESTTVHETQSGNFDTSDLNNDMLFSDTSLPKVNNSETEGNSDSHSISYNSENLQLPPKTSVSADQNSDIFNDIFNDIPPAFEKPKEPKKSKNVNALFDDDSEDEALFFKKNDTMSDEKPDLSPVSKEDNLFRIFSDEPPAIDVDFTQNITKSQKSKIEDSKLFNSIVPEDSIETIMNENEISNSNRHISLQTDSQIDDKPTEKNCNIESKKSIGKLKMNINIDVNTLLPGASPKKNKVVEQVDGQVVSSVNVNTNNVEDSESKIVNSVTFSGEADSELLDNKLSKERAKIQVKRRPSTRRARREAVKKSGIDFVNTDTTDDTNVVNHSRAFSQKEAMDETFKDIVKDSSKLDNDKEQNIKSKIVYILNDEDIFSDANTNKNAAQNVEAALSNNKENAQHSTAVVRTFEDDEDIFKKMNISKVENTPRANLIDKNENKESSNTEKSDDVLQNREDRKNQNVLTKSQDNSEKSIKNKASIFDDLSDDETELFQGKKSHEPKSASKATNKNIFGSDSAEELFTNNVKKPAVLKEEMPKSTRSKVVVKKSLFDDDSDEDLFSTKTSSSGGKPIPSKASEVKPIQTQSVDEDPLSLLTSNEVDYI